MQILRNCTHNGFPVVDNQNCYVGLIRRDQLIVLLKKRAFYSAEVRVLDNGGGEEEEEEESGSPLLAYFCRIFLWPMNRSL
jgi:hypothetical protein